ncbi:hypothetical protein Godav_019284 [Gossypium davidsonii]|uniref:Uncharacterized protein n=2 Tax=Gossypium TaxID=3633 RepID=A0A7J8R009_GOSDV|nr:hypothetical protein [Gossypium davidsonii]MBA0641838.1 hypothetical protein [Gossypium klotzschianum]
MLALTERVTCLGWPVPRSNSVMKLLSCEQKSFNWSFCRFLLQCSNRDILGGWCDSGSIFVVDVIAKG